MSRIKERADFHTHLGKLSNDEIINQAITHNVTALTVLDRVSVKADRLISLSEQAAKANIRIIPGVECLTAIKFENQEHFFELIGLGFDVQHPEIHSLFSNDGAENVQKFEEKLALQSKHLKSLGLDLDHSAYNQPRWEAIYTQHPNDLAYRLCEIAAASRANEPLINSWQNQIQQHLSQRPQDTPHAVAKYLYWSNFAIGKPGFRRWFNDFHQIIDGLHQAGGVAILAHPEFPVGCSAADQDRFIEYLFGLGVDGLEGWDAGLLNKDLARLALRHHKLVLGGSGTDLTNYSNRAFGKGEGSMFISPRRLRDIERYQQHHQSLAQTKVF